jgi:phosphoribosylformylglycinamidine synthase PurS subunit
MNYLAEIDIMPLKDLLDPQGKTVANNLKNIEVFGVEDVRIGKHIELKLEAANEEEAIKTVEAACQKLLANMIMETYRYNIKSV